ncbi:hypothetical protein DTO013E5_8452 [Penicillium roqueforti]|uniref:Genomic scaffold, ProqFM164S01 n=1 Tax=Penicillium roqueforti (strain FM164) TaxID=1365484 RepID=W6PV40_PENRF|nr:hypothetical protein CBS147337_9491 [Penicillium roqueforti]CDM27740.1 unnamed protein product [Penicillium roqueforti FM164]KAI2681059.1 hypothetical protein LCP963914a_7010 [Penicillium roqueforti]KAI2689620.1 hypothetical protein CBS147355_71 [Penicillium roqueforti]KAI2698281.1 hypothetical protein CBS147372_7299 [Penicillium roqueforti]
MATEQPISFDAIIQADRQKKKQEDLANKLLGKNRRSSAPGSGSGAGKKVQNKSQNTKPGSLASRVGVTKRSASATVQPNKNKPAPTTNNNRTHGKPGKNDRVNADQARAALQSQNGQMNTRSGNVAQNSRPLGGSNMTIKGASGPFFVVGRNFAPGTTAADIQSALEPITGPMLSCQIIASQPSVTAAFAYADKTAAELVVANFHNQRADGRLLTMTLKSTKPATQQDPFSALRAQADQERIRARRGPSHLNDLLSENRGNSPTGLYSDEMMVDAPARNTQKNQNQRRWRR